MHIKLHAIIHIQQDNCYLRATIPRFTKYLKILPCFPCHVCNINMPHFHQHTCVTYLAEMRLPFLRFRMPCLECCKAPVRVSVLDRVEFTLALDERCPRDRTNAARRRGQSLLPKRQVIHPSVSLTGSSNHVRLRRSQEMKSSTLVILCTVIMTES